MNPLKIYEENLQNNKRIFWIYFIISTFFSIVAISIISLSRIEYFYIVWILLLISNVFLSIMIYHTSSIWYLNYHSYFSGNGLKWILVNSLFIGILIFEIVWAAEITKIDSFLISMFGLIVIILTFLLYNLLIISGNFFQLFKYTIYYAFYISIWIVLTIYTSLN